MGMETKRKCSLEDTNLHINIVELQVALPFQLLLKKTVNAIYIHIDILSDILKIGGTTDKNLVELSKEIWKYLLLKQFTLTVEYLSDILNTRAYWKSRDSKNLQEWKLSPVVFQHIYRKIESK